MTNKDCPSLSVIDGGAAECRARQETAFPPQLRCLPEGGDESLARSLASPLRRADHAIGHLLAGEHGPLREEQRQALRVAGEATEFLVSLVSLLDLAEAGDDGEGRERKFDLRFPLQDVVEEHAALSRKKRIKLNLEIPRETLPVAGGREATRTVLRFALREHLYLAPYGASLRVTARADDDDSVRVTIRRGAGRPGPVRPASRAGRERGVGERLLRAFLESRGVRLDITSKGAAWHLTFPAPDTALSGR